MRQRFSRAPFLVTAALAASLPVSAFGQTGQSMTMQSAVQAVTQPTGPVQRLTVDEAVKSALEHNLGIQIQRLDPQIQDVNVAQNRSFWAPSLQTTLSKGSNNSPSTSVLSGSSSSITSGSLFNAVGISELTPWGGSYSAAWNNSRATTSDISNTFNPKLQSSLQLQYNQPLLRNFRIDNVRLQVINSKKTRDMSDVQLQATIVQTARAVKNAYWDLVYQLDNYKAVQRSLELAQQSLKDNTRRVEIGTMAPIDIVDARSEVARNEEAVIVAAEAIQGAEDSLKMLIYDPATPDFWNVKIEPADTVPFQAQAIDVDGAIRNALDKRTDLRQAKTTIEQSDISLRYFRNQILPDVNAQVNYSAIGIGGLQLEPINLFDPSTGAARAILGQRSLAAAMGDVFRSNYPAWTVGVQFSYPLGTSTARANLERAKLTYQQSGIQLKNLEMQIAAQVRNVARQVQANQKRVESARAARELAEEKLAAEEKKFAAGIRETFFVFQAQRDLASARTAEVRAISDYNKSLVDFEAVQEVPVGGGTSGVSSAGAGAIQTGNAIVRQGGD
jgi:outer membrane protein